MLNRLVVFFPPLTQPGGPAQGPFQIDQVQITSYLGKYFYIMLSYYLQVKWPSTSRIVLLIIAVRQIQTPSISCGPAVKYSRPLTQYLSFLFLVFSFLAFSFFFY